RRAAALSLARDPLAERRQRRDRAADAHRPDPAGDVVPVCKNRELHGVRAVAASERPAAVREARLPLAESAGERQAAPLEGQPEPADLAGDAEWIHPHGAVGAVARTPEQRLALR